jgi:hypothetical protein
MSEWIGPVSQILKYTSKICPFLLRRYYTEKRLSSFLLMDISSSGEGVSYYFPSQEARCWLFVTNLSPFDFTIDRLQVTVTVDGGSFTCNITLPELVKGGSRQRIFVKGKSPLPENAAPLAKKSKKANVEIEAYIKSSIRSFGLRCHVDDMRNLEVL